MKWTKPNGTEIETNDLPETIAYGRSLGWVPEGEQEKDKPKALTIDEICLELEARGIEYDRSAGKKALRERLEAS